jgi:hypothetical protein
MELRLQILVILVSLSMILVVLELIRRGRLREEHSLVWLAGACVILVLAIFRGSLNVLASFLGISYAPSMVFMVGLVMVAVIQLVQTVAISRLTVQNRDLAQLVAILQWHIRNLMERVAAEEGLELSSVAADAMEDREEKERVTHDKTKDTGDRSRWGNVRSAEAMGRTGDASHVEPAANRGDGGRAAEYDPAYDGAGVDVVHDREEPGQAWSV